ncbi:MAG: hypothetical protein K2L42_04080 [Clostridia bacterium]|nr:hypothetical protein [Clostridia bacterium]
MFKIIAKTALKVLLALVIALIIAFTVASLGFPKAMAEFFEKQGNYSFAKGYMSLQYTYSGDINDLAHFVQDCILAEDDGSVSKSGDKLTSHEGFAALCEMETQRLNLDYRQYICGKIACAKYRLGDKSGAIQTAENAVLEGNGFSKNNAAVQLAVEVSKAKDKECAQTLKTFAEEHGGDTDYSAEFIAALDKVING